MVYRRERPQTRKNIEKWLFNHHWSLNKLKKHVENNKHQFSSSFKTQLNKMLEEERIKDFVNNFEYEDGFPVVLCDMERGQLVFYCPWCHRKHRHGPTPGHRCSHCHAEGSPFSNGYILKLKEASE